MKFRAVLAAITAAMLLAALTVASGGAAADPSPPAAKPTVVLVHGAFSDSSSWNGVIDQLETGGYPVIAVANFAAACIRTRSTSAISGPWRDRSFWPPLLRRVGDE